jgi:hypothetical protein
MKIGSIDFAGFGSLSGQKIEFDPARLNVVLETDPHAVMAIKAAIWACLFGFARVKKLSVNEVTDLERFAPADLALPYIAGIDVSTTVASPALELKVIRDFSDEAVQVVDYNKEDADVTRDFLDANNEDLIGLKITGMSREIFRKLCFVSPSELVESRVGSLTDLCRVIRDWTAGEAYPKEPRAAVMALEEALAGFPYQGRRERGAVVLRDLEGRYYELSDKVQKLERERKKKDSGVKRQSDEGNGDSQSYTAEYLDLCSELADIDARSITAQETYLRVQHLRTELTRMGSMAKFPLDLQKQIEELWVRRQSRQADYDAAFVENNPIIRDYEVRENRVKDHFYGLDVFNASDAVTLVDSSAKYQNLSEELHHLGLHIAEELQKLEEDEVDLQSFEPERSLVLSLEPQQYEESKHYIEVLQSSLLQSADCKKALWRFGTLVKEVEEKRETKHKSSRIFFLASVCVCVLIAAILAILYETHAGLILLIGFGVLLTIGFGGCMYYSLFAFAPALYKRKEFQENSNELARQTKLHEDLEAKIAEVTSRLSVLSSDAGISEVADFLERLQAYMAKGDATKNLDLLEQRRSGLSVQIAELKEAVEPYFHRCGRYKKSSPEDAVALAAEIKQFLEESKSLIDNSQTVKQAKQRLDFLSSEVTNVDQQIIQICGRAKVENLDDAQEAYREFYSKVAAYHHWHALQTELRRLETDMSSGFVADELPPQIERLGKQRREKFTRMQVLLMRFPQLSKEMPVLDELLRAVANVKAQAALDAKPSLEQLRSERDFLASKVLSANIDDAGYQELAKQLARVQYELNIVRRVKNALENAKEKIYGVSPKDVWLDKVIVIIEDMLMEMGVELNQAEQSDSAARVDDPSYSIGKTFALKTVEQVRWFARLVAAKILGSTEPYVLVMEEAFGGKNEAMRPDNLTFLLELLNLQFELIVITSNPSHYKTAFTAIDESQRGLLLSCGRSAL